MGLTSIVIPTSNGREWLVRCLESIRTFTPEPHEIIVVDNGPDDGSSDYCIARGIRLIGSARPLGFPAAVNLGLRWSAGDAVVVMNNDVEVAPGWLGNMLRCLNSDPAVGLVGPMADVATGIQRSGRSFRSQADFHRAAARLNRPDPRKWRETNRLVGLCLLIKRSALEKVGAFDERFSPGYYEDDDYCYRTRAAGFRLLVAGDAHVRHAGGSTFRRMDKRALLRRNRKRFMDKWGVDPHAVIGRRAPRRQSANPSFFSERRQTHERRHSGRRPRHASAARHRNHQ